MRFRYFLPRSNSKLVFVLVMASYIYFLSNTITKVYGVFGTAPARIDSPFRSLRPNIRGFMEVVILSPVIESLILIGILELSRKVGLPYRLQVFVSALLMCITHSFQWLPWGFFVAPAFLIFAYSYLHWRQESWITGFLIISLTHTLDNFITFLYMVRIE